MQEMQERPCGATDENVVQSGVSRKGQASKPLNFQTSGARQCPTQSANQRGASAPHVFVERDCLKKEPPGGGSFWGWGKAHCAGAVRLTDTPTVKGSSPKSWRAASGTVSSTVPNVMLVSFTVCTFTFRSEPVSPGTFTVRA